MREIVAVTKGDHGKAMAVAEVWDSNLRECFSSWLLLVQLIAFEIAEAREEERIRCADICQKFISDPYTSDTATEAENIRNLIINP